MKSVLSVLLFVLLKVAVTGQTTFKLSGTVVDANSKPILYADILLLEAADSSILNGTTTDIKGRFIFEAIKNGEYLMKTNYTGFEQKITGKIFINNQNVELNKIILKESSTAIGEVQVISNKKEGFVEGAMVYKLDSNKYVSGETALDFLKTIPSIGFDMEDRITLRGSETTILIDDVESDLSEMLDQIPLSAIESIEVMAVPSVKYESKNGGGIINIRLKQDMKEGRFLNLKTGIGIREKKDLSANFRYNRRFWKYSLIATYSHSKNETVEDNLRTVGSGNSIKYLKQNQIIFNIPSSFFVTPKATYYFQPASFIDFQYTLQGKKQENTHTNNTKTLNSDLTLSLVNDISRKEKTENLFNQFESNFHKLNKEKKNQMDVRFLYSFNVPGTQYAYMVQPLDIVTLAPKKAYNSENRRYENHISFYKLNSDYSKILSKIFKIGIGGNASGRSYDQELFSTFTKQFWDKAVNKYVETTTENESHFNYKGLNFSFYSLLSGTLNKYSFSGGLRYEYTFSEAKTENRESIRLHKLLPSLHLKKMVKKGYYREFSFTSRSKPPTYSQLNPISQSFSIYNRTLGNPDLLPEYYHQAEWVNSLQKNKNTLNFALYLKNISNVIGRYYFLEVEDGKTITYSRYDNLGENRSIGIDLTSNFVSGKWNILPGINTFYNQIITKRDDALVDRKKIISNLKLNTNYNLSKTISIQSTARYFSSLISTFGNQSGYFVFDAGVRAKVLKRKGILNLKVLDVFNTHEFNRVVDQNPGYIIEGHVDPKSFMIFIDLSYSLTTTR